MCFLNSDILRANLNGYFVETGSYIGDGINFAKQAGFKKIISIEITDKYLWHCRSRFQDDLSIKIIQGDSALILGDVIKDINEPITFWLDGHCSCGDTGMGIYYCPLLAELEQIKNHPIKNHRILIDDVRCWRDYNPVHGLTIDDCIKKIKEINEDYKFTYGDGAEKNDILICKV